MAGKQEKIDGGKSLETIRKRCQNEQGTLFQITSIKGDTETVGNKVILFNLAKFTMKDDNQLGTLKFVDVKDKSAAEIKKIKDDMKDAGQTLLCDVSEIFVSKNATKVLVFGKN